jgi:hypothetical protein
VASFDSPDLRLADVLNQIDEGKIQLPDFQREWKWDDDRIVGLLASIGRGHPVGVLMLLETGGDGTTFAPKPIAGAPPTNGKGPDQLVLDGQQRLTSLYQSLRSGRPVETVDARGKRLKRWYYVDMNAALADGIDLEDAILSIPEDRVIRDNFGKDIVADYSSPEREAEAEAFPLALVFDQAATLDWQQEYLNRDPERVADRLDRWKAFLNLVLNQFTHYTVPAIVLKRETPKEAVCTVFEKVNTGGVPLDVFELLTATFAAENFRLKDDWKGRKERLDQHSVLRGIQNTDFLQIVALLATRARRQAYTGSSGTAPGIGCKRRDILNLKLDEYKKWAPEAESSLDWAAHFMNREYIFTSGDVPYRTQLVPLAAVRSIVGSGIDQYGRYDRLRNWYWCGVLGELYGGAIETRFARDVEQLPGWLDGGPTPNTVNDAAFQEQRLLSLRTRNSAAYKGLYALLMRKGSPDWMHAQSINVGTFHSLQIDIHHIFPKAWCAKNGIDRHRQESIVNKTAIARKTNLVIGGRSPQQYLPLLEKQGGLTAERLDDLLLSHEIDPVLLRAADFDGFFEHRKDRLLDLVGEAMGKEPARDVTTVDQATAEYEDEPEESEAEPDVEELDAQHERVPEAPPDPGLPNGDAPEASSSPRRAWDVPTFLQAVFEDQGDEAKSSAEAVIEWAMQRGLRLWFGEGQEDASVMFMLDVGATSQFTFGLRSYTGVELQFKWMRPPFDELSRREWLRQQLIDLPGVEIGEDRLEGLPRIPWQVVIDSVSRAQLLSIFDWVIDETRAD